ncbi:hypothetical protein COCMIDRAFT_104220 [Bipolaris oryzae ATCC 44560]|uniref:Zn(2)-C6 fungal-type domain-containing protein n=1 Tax=Bipolaris oryzae ATCC 44560 TaxID=930090 RepID=W6YXD4_COCMI|nr:uncharacterized protein COCMIDRAFT_104220 [Bipolaris oryzae ATCC 44560]EUC42188.1 hypothetical protein COCMIDRAFT_104220 [Bipolaris oryzae ATCC 44560]
MDDLLEGYMVLDAIGDFLEDRSLTHRTKHPATTPQSQPGAQASTGSLTPISDPDQNSQGEAPKGARKRRGHNKSRLGCIACKKRKIKCQETWPSCANCDRRALVCRYPDVFKHAQHELPRPKPPSPRQVVQLSDKPIMYSPDDMQLFHHYLTAAYPCIPSNNEQVWTRHIPLKTYQYPYLMNAMLALAGSHLAIQVENPNNRLALRHRQNAIVGLEDAFARWPPSPDESHVMFAASFLLSLQCSYLNDGFLEHFISLRGCSLLSQLIVAEGFNGPFVEQTGVDLIPVDTATHQYFGIGQDILREALLSLKSFSKFMTPEIHPIEKAVVGQTVVTLQYLLCPDVQPEGRGTTVPDIEGTADPSQSTKPSKSGASANPLLPSSMADVFHEIDWDNITTAPAGSPSPVRSFQGMMAVLTIFATWPQEALVHIFDSNNRLGNIILAHFSAIRFILAPMTAEQSALRTPTRAIVQWSAKIIASIDGYDKGGEWSQYVEWPRKILRCVEFCLEKHRGFTIGDVRDLFLRDPGAFKEGRAPRI